MSNPTMHFAAALTIGSLIGIGVAVAENRVALVIGNSDYRGVSPLPNPANDAKAVTELLRAARFEVVQASDLTQTEMRRAMRNFAATISERGPDTVALVFYAGHGLQVDGENFLVPVDARIDRESDVAIEAIRFDDLMNTLEAVPSKTRIVILDACRNNPFAEIRKSTGRGLAMVNAPVGSVVAYSTSPGTEAEDGTGGNSPFTAAFIAAAREPGAPVEQTLKKVRLNVHQATAGRQTPWEVLSLTSEFAFFPGPGGAGSARSAKDLVAAKPAGFWKRELQKRPPAEAFDLVIQEDSIEAYQEFVALYPVPPFGPRVRGILDRRVEMMTWYNAVTVNTIGAYQAFLASYPNSDLAATARKLMERARTRSAVASTNPAALGAPPATRSTGAPGGGPPAAVTPVAVSTPPCTCEKPPTKKTAKPPREKSASRPPRGPGRLPTDADVFGPGGPPSAGPPVSIGIGVGIPIGRSRPSSSQHPN